jgi:hypothetical protein
MNKLDKQDVRAAIRCLDNIKELTDLLRAAHYEVPMRQVYAAAASEKGLRDLLLGAALCDVELEARV